MSTDCTGPSTGPNAYANADQKQVSLPPNTTARNEEDGRGARAEEIVAGQESDIGEVTSEKKRDGDCVRRKNRSQGGREDTGEAQDKCDEIATP